MTRTRLLRLLLVFLLLVSAAPVLAQDDIHGDEGASVNTALPQVGPDVTLRFEAVIGDLPASCGMIYSTVGAGESPVSLMDFRFYVSNVRLINAAGEEVPVELTQDGLWQYQNVALLDFEDATGNCGEGGTPEINTKITGSVPEGEYIGIVFDLGVPFELNHLDAATAPAPLNLPAMWWLWQSGYKFARVDLLTPEGGENSWLIHLGSTGCESENFNTPPESPCSNPNVTTVRLEGFNPVENFIVADLTGLLTDVNLDEAQPEPPGCMSGTDDADCAALFPGFGLALATGTPEEASAQTFFRVK